jgi:hypothetical protein
VSDYVDPAFLAPLNLDQLTKLLEKVDLTLEEGRELREKIVRAMYERRQSSGPHAISNRGKSESFSS